MNINRDDLKRTAGPVFRFLIFYAVCALVIYPALTGEFLQWDDDKNIYRNQWLLDGDVLRFWTEKFYFLLYIPVTYSFWTGLWALSHDPLAFHLFSLTLHVLNVNSVYLITRKLFPDIGEKGAWCAALVFAIMPLQIEAFAWISVGRDLLGLQFALGAIYLLLCSRSWKGLSGSVIVFAIGLLSKPTVAPLPVALVCLGAARALMTRKHYLTLGLWLVLAFFDLLWNRMVQQIGFDAKVATVNVFERVLISFDTLGFYISKFVVPYPLNADYARMPWKVIGQTLYWPQIGIVAATATLLVYLQRRFKLAIWDFSLFFLIGLSPVLGFIPFLAQAQSTVADRYVYWPWISVAMLIAVIASRSKHGYKALAVVLVVWGVVGFERSYVWRDDDTLFTDMVTKSPDSFTANNALGAFAFERRQWKEAEQRFKIAHELMPHRAGVVSNLAQLYWATNKKAEIRTEIEPFLRDPNWIAQNTAEYIPLSVLYLVTGRLQKEDRRWELANDSLCRAYQLYPENFSAKLEVVRSIAEIEKGSGHAVDCVKQWDQRSPSSVQ